MQVPSVQTVEAPQNSQNGGASSQRATTESSEAAGVFLLLLAQLGQASSITLAPGLTGEGGETLEGAAQEAGTLGAGTATSEGAAGGSLSTGEAPAEGAAATTAQAGVSGAASEAVAEGEAAPAEPASGKAQYRMVPAEEVAQATGSIKAADAAQADAADPAKAPFMARAKLDVMPNPAAKIAAPTSDTESLVAAKVQPEVQPASGQAETPPLHMDVKVAEVQAESGETHATASRDGLRPEPTVTLRELSQHAVKSVRYLVSQGERTMKVRLIPESLGELRLEVTASGSAITVRMASANPAVREVLEGQLHGLRDALAQDGFDSTDVYVSADASSGQGESPWMQHGAHESAEAPKTRAQATGSLAASERGPGVSGEPLRSSPHTGTFSVSV